MKIDLGVTLGSVTVTAGIHSMLSFQLYAHDDGATGV
jgi:hypothetical protein